MSGYVFERRVRIDVDGVPTPARIAIGAPEHDDNGHYCRVALEPLLRGERPIHGADAAQAFELARQFVRSMLAGRVVRDGEDVIAPDALFAGDVAAPSPSPGPKWIVLRHPLGWVASGFGVGLAPKAAGTFGSLAALVPWWLWLRHLPLWQYAIVLVAAFALGVWASAWVIAKTRIEDPGVVVWDEFVGQWIALLPVTLLEIDPDGVEVAIAFVLFRLFDIWKPWPVRWADRSVHGGLGAMLDDALAGLMAWVALHGALVAMMAVLGIA
jgi:phosphatidylglycerophosphatase A